MLAIIVWMICSAVMGNTRRVHMTIKRMKVQRDTRGQDSHCVGGKINICTQPEDIQFQSNGISTDNLLNPLKSLALLLLSFNNFSIGFIRQGCSIAADNAGCSFSSSLTLLPRRQVVQHRDELPVTRFCSCRQGLLSGLAIFIVPYTRDIRMQHGDFLEKVSTDAAEDETDGAQKDGLLAAASLPLTPYWLRRLERMTRPTARSLISALSPNNVLMFENKGGNKEGTLLNFAVKEKAKHEDKVLLIRQGDFYETYGIDSLMLVEYAGLNPMGGKPRAGCPVANLQVTLDCLTTAGLTVAVYEEVDPARQATVGLKGPVRQVRQRSNSTGRGIKERRLSQVVSAGSPMYLYNRCLSPNPIDYAEPLPYAAVAHAADGFILVHVFADERTYHVHQRLSQPALRALLAARRHAPPLLVGNTLGAATNSRHQPASFAFLQTEKRTLLVPGPGQLAEAAVSYVAQEMQLDPAKFVAAPLQPYGLFASPRPIYVPTATQVGLLPCDGIPDLVRALLPRAATADSVALLRRWLLIPPRPTIADAMHAVCAEFATAISALPLVRPVPVGKMVRLLTVRQANVHFFYDLAVMLSAVSGAMANPQLQKLNENLLSVVADEAGAASATPEELAVATGDAHSAIDSLLQLDQFFAPNRQIDINSYGSEDLCDDSNSNADKMNVTSCGVVPQAFFNANEKTFRGLLRPDHAVSEHAELSAARVALCEAVGAHLPDGWELLHVPRDNSLVFSKVSSRRVSKVAASKSSKKVSNSAGDLVAAQDRLGRKLDGKLISKGVYDARLRYLAACEDMQKALRSKLQALCDTLSTKLPMLCSAAHWALFYTTISAHVGTALQKGWVLPGLRPTHTDERGMHLRGMWPYWLDGESAARNTFEWNGLWLLTAPNMAGKSSLMRGMLAAALLANAGLFAPLKGGLVPRYDAYFLRTASYDVPSEGRSAFAQEMDDVFVLTSECGVRSMILLDELGRGTSAREGSAIAVALLEWLQSQGMSAIFATHLYEIEEVLERAGSVLPALQRKTMDVTVDPSSGDVEFHFTLADGMCNDSLALHAARSSGVPDSIVQRAAELLKDNPASDFHRNEQPVWPSVGPFATQTDWHKRNFSVNDVALGVARRVLDEREPMRLLPKEVPPPSSVCSSFVYLLAPEYESGLWYVGETDNLASRWSQHRKSRKLAAMYAWTVTGGKSAARRLETRLIESLLAKGVALSNSADGSHVAFGAGGAHDGNLTAES